MQQYKVEYNNVNCNLPMFTRSIKKRVDDINKKISNAETPIDDKIESIYEFLKEIIGEEVLVKVLGNDDLEEIDLNDVNILYLKVTKEYDRPVVDFNKPVLDPDTKRILKEVTNAAKSLQYVSPMTPGAQV